jgi:hypothetical protein
VNFSLSDYEKPEEFPPSFAIFASHSTHISTQLNNILTKTMSWKGFKKAVVRLPHMLQSKAGYSDSNYVDSEFDELRSQFEELQQLSVRLHDAASKYREAVQSMLKHQEAFSKVLLEVYEPIPGKFEGSSGALSGQTNSMKRIRQQTAETSLSRAQLFQQSCSNLSAELMSQIV